jgi:hypothetical protein
MAQPILVIGRNRSGTKWLSNIIANHEDVASVQRPGAGGILETNLFSHVADAFGDPGIDENYLGFLAFFSKTNFFRVSGLEEADLYARRCTDYPDFFRMIMDTIAEKKHQHHWVQKTSSLNLPALVKEFGDAKYVIILLGYLFSYFHHKKRQEAFIRSNPALVIGFEQLRADKETTARRVFEFLGLQFSEDLLRDKFERNTSFGSNIQRENVLNATDRFLIRLISVPLSLTPLWTFSSVHRLRRRLGARNQRRFAPKTFSLFKKDIGW